MTRAKALGCPPLDIPKFHAFEPAALAPIFQHFEERHGTRAITQATEEFVTLRGLTFGVEISRGATREKLQQIFAPRIRANDFAIVIDGGDAGFDGREFALF